MTKKVSKDQMKLVNNNSTENEIELRASNSMEFETGVETQQISPNE